MFGIRRWRRLAGWGISLASALAMLPPLAEGAGDGRFVVLPESEVQLNGSATLRRWSCKSKQVSGFVEVGAPLQDIDRLIDRVVNGTDPAALDQDLPAGRPSCARIVVPVRSLACGNAAMERDMYKALKAEQFPTVEYEFFRVEDVAVLRASDAFRFKIQTEGILEIAGARQVVRMDVMIERRGEGYFKISGRKRVKMTDFGITPPSAFLGLIRAHDPVDLIFDLIVRMDPQ